MYELLIYLFLGILAGTFTGLAPGIHTNTLAILLSTFLATKFGSLALAVFIVSMIITHSFLDLIPSIFLGAPDQDSVLSVLPGHKYLLQGKGYQALKLTLYGGLGCSILLIPLIIPFLYAASFIENTKYLIPIILAITTILFILDEKQLKNKLWALLLFLLSGILGIQANQLIKEYLFVILTGFFALPTLILSIKQKTNIPTQIIDKTNDILSIKRIKVYIKTLLASFLVAPLPAIGTTGGAIITQKLFKANSSENFLIITGALNTLDAFYNLIILFFLNRVRSGATLVIKQFTALDKNTFFILLLISFIALFISCILTIYFGRLFARIITKINYPKISKIILLFLLILILVYSNFLGLFVAILATALGIIAPKVGVKRIHLLGCLTLPILISF